MGSYYLTGSVSTWDDKAILGNNGDDDVLLLSVHNTTTLDSFKLLKWLHMEVNTHNSSIQKAMAGGSQEASLSLKKKKKR